MKDPLIKPNKWKLVLEWCSIDCLYKRDSFCVANSQIYKMKLFGKSKKVETLSTVKIYKDEVCSYKNPVTGQAINWTTRNMDFKVNKDT